MGFNFTLIPDFAFTPEIYITDPTAYLVVEVSSDDSSYTGILEVDGNAIKSPNSSDSASSFLQTSDDTFTAEFSYTQTSDDNTLKIIPTTNITFTQLQTFLLGAAEGVETYSNAFFPNQTIFTAVDLTQFTINGPEIAIITFPNPVYYLTGTATSSSPDSGDAAVNFLTTNIGGYQNSFLYLNFSSGNLGFLTQTLLQGGSDSNDIDK